MAISRKISLGEYFYFKEDRIIIEKQRALRKMKETKDALKKVTGIHSEAVLQKLVDLNISPETAASLALVPIIEVAWADGAVDPEEKAAILLVIKEYGWIKGSIDYVLLEQWMEHRPNQSMFKAWVHYIAYICEKMTQDEARRFKNEIMEHATTVAQSCGGIFGIGKISKEEKKVLVMLKNAFKS